jgi:hypothetical protein
MVIGGTLLVWTWVEGNEQRRQRHQRDERKQYQLGRNNPGSLLLFETRKIRRSDGQSVYPTRTRPRRKKTTQLARTRAPNLAKGLAHGR